jgi:aryl-alcohol dehydrogenase-like predicted oxidoreductase
MEYRSIGQLRVSLVGLGCNNFGMRIDETAARAVIQSALDCGVTFFDTADVYGGGQSESILGSVLDGPDVVVATKFGYDRENPEVGQCDPGTIHRSVRASLARLRRDRIELYQMHRPDPRVPIEETLGALAELQREGLIGEIGCTGVEKSDLDAARRASTASELLPAFASVQNEYSMLVRTAEAAVLPECVAQGLAFLPFFPLADGLLSGKYHAGVDPAPGSRLQSYGPAQKRRILTSGLMELVGSLDDFARRRGKGLNQLAIAWLASRPAVASVIAGATTPDQVIGNSAASGWVLDSDEVATIEILLDRFKV